MATLGDGTERSKSISVQIDPQHEMPLVTIEPQRPKVPQGTNAVVTCKTEGGDDANFQWTVNSKPTLPQNVQVTGGTLRINNIQMANRGYYTCKCRQTGREYYEAITTVDIEYREMPVLQILHNCTQTVIAGSTVDFLCHPIEGIPEVEVEWSRQDQRPFSRNVQILFGDTMRIRSVSEYDEGAYTCVAQNVVGTTTATVTLEVNSYPEIAYT